ncbi:MAG: hypothetical protein KJN96_07095, partial [Eudoraea sp.]|nr:hypothetical protein [Eudoraea sp.]
MKKTALTIAICFCTLQLQAQYVVKNPVELAQLRELPQELIYVNHTGPVVFTGEYLYYGLHCFNVQTRRTSQISKIAYVALIDQEGKTLFEHKLRLSQGKSYGDYFMPTTLETGTYKLVAYTQWMKNSGVSQIFQDDIAVINPYRKSIPKSESEVEMRRELGPVNADSSLVGIVMEKKRLQSREQGVVRVRNYKGALGKGSYSVWIKRQAQIPFTRAKTAATFVSQYNSASKRIQQSVGDSLFLPEQRGELIYGTVKDIEGKPRPDELMYLSFPGPEFLLKFATSDANGKFYAYVRETYSDNRLIMQSRNIKEELQIQLGKPSQLDYGELKFSGFQILPEWKDAILARSVRNQIENQFFEVKPDSVLLEEPRDPFDGGIPETILLDEYTRFPTFEETLVELLSKAGYRSGPNGTSYIRIAQDFETFDEPYNNDPALVLIDGVMIRDHASIRDFDARRIEKIEMIRDQFQLADQAYQGMMVVSTYEGDYADSFRRKNSSIAELHMAQPEKNYFIQEYSEGGKARVPDYRNILLWQPHLALDSEAIDLEFYT